MFHIRSMLLNCWLRLGDELGAVNELPSVLTDVRELHHRVAEVGHHQLLVVNHALPFASSTLELISQPYDRFANSMGMNIPGHGRGQSQIGDASR